MKHQALAWCAVSAVVSGCAPGPQYPPLPDPGPCVVDDDPDRGTVAQPLVYIPPAGVELFLDEGSGGPLRCRPSVAECPALEGCVGAPVALPVGADATLAVGLRTVTEGPSASVIAVDFDADTSPAFSVLEPIPFQLPTGVGSETFVFIGVRPAEVGPLSARVFVFVDATNAPEGGRAIPITLQVEGVPPP